MIIEKVIPIGLKKKRMRSPLKLTALSFLAVIFIGSVLLSLPVSNNVPDVPYINHLFVSVSAVCVTGLTPVVLAHTYTAFGHIVIMLLVQIGGLGLYTFIFFFLYMMRKSISRRTELVFEEALNQDDLHQLPRVLKTIIAYTFGVEGAASLLWMTVFIPRYGVGKGIFYGIWHSISAFCNAGFDLLGSDSLVAYQNNDMVNLVACTEIILGGIGFLVVLNVRDTWKHEHNKKCVFSFGRFMHNLSLHTKLVFVMTITLLLVGMVLFWIFEDHNILKGMGVLEKAKISFFQSTTTRTAGFATVDIHSLRTITKLFFCAWMFIGGSPASTAGGIKTVTFAVIILTLISVYRGHENVDVFDRRIPTRIVLRSFTIFSLGQLACVIAMGILTITDSGHPLHDLMLEVFSAFGTVGLSASVTPTLSVIGKIVIMIMMYMGRVGPVTLMLLFAGRSKKQDNEIEYPEKNVLVG